MANVCITLATMILMLNDNSDFADTYPSAEVSGIDITPIHGTVLPENYEFTIDDINLSLYEEEENNWDLIHVREMGGGVKNWLDLLRKLYM